MILDIIAITISILALFLSIPAMILSIKQSKKLSFKIDFYCEEDSILNVIKKNDGLFYCETRFVIKNQSDQDSTISKITVIDKNIEEELIHIYWNGESVFNNIPFEGNSIISKGFSFEIKTLPKRKLTFKIYTNRKTFTKKIAYRLKELHN